MPSPLSAYSREFNPFPTQFTKSESGEGRAAFTIMESFAKEETVLLIEARPHWEYDDGGEPTDAVFDVVAAYSQDMDTTNPATSLATVTIPHGRSRRFMIGIPTGHKLVVYPADEARGGQIVGAAADSYLTSTIVDYWA
jgi:hypothetical protein